MINEEFHYRLFYYLCTNDSFVSSNYLASKTGVSIRTIKYQMSDFDTFLKGKGCKLISKRRYGYKLEIIDQNVYFPIKESTINYIKYSHSYKGIVNDIMIYFGQELLFSKRSFQIEDISDDLFIAFTTFKKYFTTFYEQLKTFDITLKKEQGNHFSLKGREKDFRLFAKDYLIINLTDIINHNYDFKKLKWSNNRFDFYELHSIVDKVLSSTDIGIFEIGKYRITCYLYISCLRLNYPIDIKISKIKKYISLIEMKIANDIAEKVKAKYNINFNNSEIASLALNFLCERDYTPTDIDNGSVSNELINLTLYEYNLAISSEFFTIINLYPKKEFYLWLVTIFAKVIASNHKQDKPYFFYSDKSVYYSSFSFFIARLYASFVKTHGSFDERPVGPTLNIYCISYITNAIYTNLMLTKLPCRKINVGVYSFLGNLTSLSFISAIKNSYINTYINSVKVLSLHQITDSNLDLVLIHQKTDDFAIDTSTKNHHGLSSDNFISKDDIQAIKLKYLETSNYQNYLALLDNISFIWDKRISSFNCLYKRYTVFADIKEKYQIVSHDNDEFGFLFVKQTSQPFLDIYLLRQRFSVNKHRYKIIFVVPVDLTNKDITYYKTMEAISQVLYRCDYTFYKKQNMSQLKDYLIEQVKKYLVDCIH